MYTHDPGLVAFEDHFQADGFTFSADAKEGRRVGGYLCVYTY